MQAERVSGRACDATSSHNGARYSNASWTSGGSESRRSSASGSGEVPHAPHTRRASWLTAAAAAEAYAEEREKAAVMAEIDREKRRQAAELDRAKQEAAVRPRPGPALAREGWCTRARVLRAQDLRRQELLHAKEEARIAAENRLAEMARMDEARSSRAC
jgi:hypothetical protein